MLTWSIEYVLTCCPPLEGTSSEEGVGICFAICEHLLEHKVGIERHHTLRLISPPQPSIPGVHILCHPCYGADCPGHAVS